VDIEAVACVHNLQYRFSTGTLYCIVSVLVTLNHWCGVGHKFLLNLLLVYAFDTYKIHCENIIHVQWLEQLWKMSYLVFFAGVSEECQISFLQLH